MKLIASDGAIYQCNEEPSSTITLAPVKYRGVDELNGARMSFSPRDPLICLNGRMDLLLFNIANGSLMCTMVENMRYNQTFFSNSGDKMVSLHAINSTQIRFVVGDVTPIPSMKYNFFSDDFTGSLHVVSFSGNLILFLSTTGGINQCWELWDIVRGTFTRYNFLPIPIGTILDNRLVAVSCKENRVLIFVGGEVNGGVEPKDLTCVNSYWVEGHEIVDFEIIQRTSLCLIRMRSRVRQEYTFAIHDIESGERICLMESFTPCSTLALSPDQSLAFFSPLPRHREDGSFCIVFDVATGRRLNVEKHEGPLRIVTSIIWEAASEVLIFQYQDASILTCFRPILNTIVKVHRVDGNVRSCSASLDGRLMVYSRMREGLVHMM